MIYIIDYGLGNIQAFTNVYKRLNIPVSIARTKQDILEASHLILPGVGSFDHAMNLINKSGLRDALDTIVLDDGKPIIGICVGMQMLADSSEEGSEPGLGWIKGKVRSFASNPLSANLPMPHMGWNDVHSTYQQGLFKNLEDNPRFYFLHSFYFDCDNSNHIAASAHYGFDFTCCVQRANIFGVQFHPEKSHHWGSTLLNNFAVI